MCGRVSFLQTLTQNSDNFRYIYPGGEEEPNIAIASHKNRYWAIIDAKHTDISWYSDHGSDTVEGALQDLLKCLSTKVWQKATQQNNLSLDM